MFNDSVCDLYHLMFVEICILQVQFEDTHLILQECAKGWHKLWMI